MWTSKSGGLDLSPAIIIICLLVVYEDVFFLFSVSDDVILGSSVFLIVLVANILVNIHKDM